MSHTFYTKGYTLIEILVAVAIFVLIILVVANFQVNISKYNKSSSESLQSAQDARAILRTMVAEMRSMQPASTGAYPLAAAATSSITFFTDINDDGLREQVRYYLTGTTLKKGIIVPSGSPLTYSSASETFAFLAYNIKNGTSTALFDYFDNTYSGTSSPLTQPVSVSTVRLVKINLTIDADPNRSPLPRTYTSQAMLRNLKDNL